MKRFLVTGASTPIGIRLVERLLDDARTELVLAVAAEPAAGRRPRGDRVIHRQVDLTKPRAVRRLLFGPAKELAVEAVAHLALHRRAQDGGSKVHALNVESTRELLALTERHPTIRRFVFRSHAEVYDVRSAGPAILSEEHPLDLSPRAPQWVRDRVEADLTVCTRMGLSPLSIAVLRFAECLADGVGSQLHDYLRSRVCLRPLGYDPMLNLITVDDVAEALYLALRSRAQGIFTIPGGDTLPLSQVIRRWGRRGVSLPGPLLAPLYHLRALATGTDFRYDLNHWRFHFGGVLDGSRAERELGYEPHHAIDWPA